MSRLLLRFRGLFPVLCCLAAALTGCSVQADPAEPESPEFTSLADAYRAVDEIADCDETPPEPPAVYLPDGGATGEALMCTGSVALFWFETDQERSAVLYLLASAATPAEDKWVYFAEGKNWFLADMSDVQVGSEPDRRVNVAEVAEALGAQYTGANGMHAEARTGPAATLPMQVPTAANPLPDEFGKGSKFFAAVREHAPTLTPERVDDEQLLGIGSLACTNADDPQKQRKYQEFWIQRGFTESEVLVIFTEARTMC